MPAGRVGPDDGHAEAARLGRPLGGRAAGRERVEDAAAEVGDDREALGAAVDGRDEDAPRAARAVGCALQEERGLGGALARQVPDRDRPDPPRDVVAVEVVVEEFGVDHLDDVAAGDRLALGAAVAEDGGVVGAEVARGPGRVARGALHDGPAVVAAVLDAVDLLPRVLPHVADPEALRAHVELVGVAEAVGVDLVALGAVGGGERVVGGDAVLGALGHVVDVDPEDRAEQGRRVLPVPERVAPAAAVAEADVEVAVGAEGDRPAVVVRRGLVDAEEHALGGRVGPERVRGGPGELGHARLEHADAGLGALDGGGVADEQAAVRLVARVEREPEEAALVDGADALGEVEEDGRGGVAGEQRQDARRERGVAVEAELDHVGPGLARAGRQLDADGPVEPDAGERLADDDGGLGEGAGREGDQRQQGEAHRVVVGRGAKVGP